jgi:hypothetical protein
MDHANVGKFYLPAHYPACMQRAGFSCITATAAIRTVPSPQSAGQRGIANNWNCQ